MIKGFSVKNMALAILAGALVATNFHVPGLSVLDMAMYTVVLSGAAWVAIEEMEIKWGEKRLWENHGHTGRRPEIMS